MREGAEGAERPGGQGKEPERGCWRTEQPGIRPRPQLKYVVLTGAATPSPQSPEDTRGGWEALGEPLALGSGAEPAASDPARFPADVQQGGHRQRHRAGPAGRGAAADGGGHRPREGEGRRGLGTSGRGGQATARVWLTRLACRCPRRPATCCSSAQSRPRATPSSWASRRPPTPSRRRSPVPSCNPRPRPPRSPQ